MMMRQYPGRKFQPRPVPEDNSNWELRERGRFAKGEYIQLPWINALWYKAIPGHYAHISRKDPSKIAFTENAKKGAADLKTMLSPGRYLMRFFSERITKTQIKDLATQYAATYNPVKYALARTAKQIELAYLRGPNSCMSAPVDSYATKGIHPVRAYAGPDLAIAYLKVQRRITARTVCWPEKKLYSRIYGDSYRLASALHKDGYKQGNLAGARMSKILVPGMKKTYICPYVDGERIVHVTDDHLVIGRPSSAKYVQLDGSRTDGRAGPFSYECGNCGNYCEEIDHPIVVQDFGERWCDECATEYLHRCEATQQYYGNEDNIVTLHDGVVWARYYWSDNGGHRCRLCSEYFRAGETVLRKLDDQMRHVCRPCADKLDGQQALPLEQA
jgi:hypothetical protein